LSVQGFFRTEASNLGTPSRRINILLHAVQWLPKWQDRCCRASRELSSNYLCIFTKSSLYRRQKWHLLKIRFLLCARYCILLSE